jgi:hypothetical protein
MREAAIGFAFGLITGLMIMDIGLWKAMVVWVLVLGTFMTIVFAVSTFPWWKKGEP